MGQCKSRPWPGRVLPGFLPLGTAGTLQLGWHSGLAVHLPGMLSRFTASVSLAVQANHLRLGGTKQPCPFATVILLRGLGVTGSVSSPLGFLPAIDGAGSG